ncbi:MAG TPA: M14 family metallopeptidase, partial [Gemmatimonadaceae bacterium]|nr:M14 family metallopeptidase [Gemmatimonadaceae bacterium]
ADAHARGIPVVYLQANIHAGEVEGKEALLALLRDLTRDPRLNVLDSLLVIAVPIYNADGNEAFASQTVNRTEQNGPELVGQRANGQGLDLNRDYVKAEAPETRASLVAFNRWDPDVFVDMHTTDGSFHGYALTYSPSLWPGADQYTRDSLLPEIRRRVRARDGFEIFDYGNFEGEPPAWRTYDDRPRFGTNYVGLRGRVAILSEAYSHDPFERRVKATRAFVSEILSLVAERGVHHAPRLEQVPIRAEMTRAPFVAPVVRESLVATGDSSVTQPGVPRGMRRSGQFTPIEMKVYDRFAATLSVPVPAGYLVPAADTAALRLLRLHGIVARRLDSMVAGVEAFAIDSVWHDSAAFQGHRQTHLRGHWRPTDSHVDAVVISDKGRAPARQVAIKSAILATGKYFIVPDNQPLAALAVYLLEPESDDGLVTWNVFDPALGAGRGATYPVLRLVRE